MRPEATLPATPQRPTGEPPDVKRRARRSPDGRRQTRKRDGEHRKQLDTVGTASTPEDEPFARVDDGHRPPRPHFADTDRHSHDGRET